ncbi:hypothetical protein [Cyclobacterium salsum]|uniref:hypothetical protein n=1 Tax=Cyclobacterium salsum TaxID=2666329 RepID=UPI001390D7A8|nr:hypothetical protein [Cyclobacterium salsum]
MIGIKDFNALCAEWVATIPALEGHHLVAQDNHAINSLKDERGIQLVAVIPSANASGRDPSSLVDDHSTYLFVIDKGWTDQQKGEQLDQYEKTQEIILAIREEILESFEEGCGPFWRLQAESINIDPEFNIFGGWNGWSMLLSF